MNKTAMASVAQKPKEEDLHYRSNNNRDDDDEVVFVSTKPISAAEMTSASLRKERQKEQAEKNFGIVPGSDNNHRTKNMSVLHWAMSSALDISITDRKRSIASSANKKVKGTVTLDTQFWSVAFTSEILVDDIHYPKYSKLVLIINMAQVHIAYDSQVNSMDSFIRAILKLFLGNKPRVLQTGEGRRVEVGQILPS